MSTIEARTFTSGADMIAAARNVRNRLWKPHKVNIAPPLLTRLPFVQVNAPRNTTTPAQRVNDLCRSCGVPLDEIQGQGKFKHLIASRKAMLKTIVSEYPEIRLGELCKLFDRDRTTISYQCKLMGITLSTIRLKKKFPDGMTLKEYHKHVKTDTFGVRYYPNRNKWRALFSSGDYIGIFDTYEEAVDARKAKAIEMGFEVTLDGRYVSPYEFNRMTDTRRLELFGPDFEAKGAA